MSDEVRVPEVKRRGGAARLAAFGVAATDAPPGSLRLAGGALRGWFRATLLDAVIVGGMWLLGLLWIGVPFAPLWALVAGVCQFVPGVGAVLGVCGPAVAAVFASNDNSLEKLWWVLGLYGVVVVVDGLLIQPLLLKRTTRVPWWAALLGPIVGGVLLPPWGALLAAPLLAVVFAFRRNHSIRSN